MASFRWLGLSLSLVLGVGLTGCGSIGASSTPVTSAAPVANPTPTPTPTPTASNVAAPIFAFWYDAWNPQITPPDIKPADVVIGLLPPNVPKAHTLGKRVIQYQSYYQAIPNSPLLTDIADLTNVGFEINHQFVINIFDNPTNSYVMCPNSVIFHQRVQQYVQQSISSGYDGLFVDNTFFDPPAHLVCDGTHAHVDPTAEGGRAYLTLLAEVRQTIKSHNPDAILMTNPGDPFWADAMATGSPTVWDLSDYVLWESWGYMSFPDIRHDNWAAAIPKSYALAAAHPERLPQLVMLSYVKNVTEARFAFAAARFFGFNWTANLGALGFGSYLNSIPFALGDPTGPLPPQDSVLHRAFEHGEVFVNVTEAAQSVTVPAGTLYLGDVTEDIATSTDVTLQPRTAAIILFK